MLSYFLKSVRKFSGILTFMTRQCLLPFPDVLSDTLCTTQAWVGHLRESQNDEIVCPCKPSPQLLARLSYLACLNTENYSAGVEW